MNLNHPPPYSHSFSSTPQISKKIPKSNKRKNLIFISNPLTKNSLQIKYPPKSPPNQEQTNKTSTNVKSRRDQANKKTKTKTNPHTNIPRSQMGQAQINKKLHIHTEFTMYTLYHLSIYLLYHFFCSLFLFVDAKDLRAKLEST